MQQRFLNLCEDTYYPVTFGTFHSIFFQIINSKYHYNTGDIASLRNKREYMRRAIKHALSYDKPETELIDSLLKSVAYYKNCNESVRIDSDTNLSEEQFLSIYKAYRDAQIAANKIDFEDMLLIVRNLFKKDEKILNEYRQRYKYILIDEYQDINDIQFEIIKMLAAPNNNLFVVGDDDQSIYGFRGSKSELMLGFTDMYPDAVKIELNVNYRCSDKIIEAAGKIISENKVRFNKRIVGTGRRNGTVKLQGFACREEEDKWFVNILKDIHASEIAVFLRTNREASRYAELCRNAGIACDMKEAIYNPYKTEEYKDIYHYLWLAEYVKNTLNGSVTDRYRDKEYDAGLRRSYGGDLSLPGRRAQMIRTDRTQHIKRIKLPITHLFPIMNKPLRYLNRKNILCNEVSIEGLKDIYCDKPYMAKVLDGFAHQLSDMCDMDMYSRVNYIRKGIGYDEFVMNNTADNKAAYDVYTETANWIQERVKMFNNVTELDRYADEYEEMMNSVSESSAGGKSGHKSECETDDNRVHIMTYHASKGLEFDTVILPHLNEGSVPHIRSTGQSQTEEERRMFYVAMTRAKNNLYMTYVSGDKEKKCLPSRFILPLIRNRRVV